MREENLSSLWGPWEAGVALSTPPSQCLGAAAFFHLPFVSLVSGVASGRNAGSGLGPVEPSRSYLFHPSAAGQQGSLSV